MEIAKNLYLVPWILWTIAAIVFLAIEILTPGLFFFACLAVGSVAAAVTAYISTTMVAPWIVFFAVSLALLFVVAPMARHYLRNQKTEPVGLDSFIGQRAFVTEPIDPEKDVGQVKIEGELWKAFAEQPVPAECWVEVLSISGTKLKVRHIPKEEA